MMVLKSAREIILKGAKEIAILEDAGRIAAEALAWAGRNAVPGRTTKELDAGVEALIRARGAKPVFKGYPEDAAPASRFPATICVSINEEVVHGIPGPRELEEGDVVSIDVGVRYRGFVGDTAWTFAVGRVSPAAARLLRATEEALEAAIRAARVGGRLSEISRAVEDTAESYGFSLVKDYAGHGVGQDLHEEPQVPNFVDAHLLRNDVVLREGLVIAIEPMLCAGSGQTKVAADGWTVLTADGGLAAHFEHSIAFTSSGVKVLTRPDGGAK